jgi:exosortase/archaeosortase
MLIIFRRKAGSAVRMLVAVVLLSALQLVVLLLVVVEAEVVKEVEALTIVAVVVLWVGPILTLIPTLQHPETDLQLQLQVQ